MRTTRTIPAALLAAGLAFTGPFQLVAATVSKSDPVPNTPGPPADGGIGYTWTVTMDAKDAASVDGTVGAWSWDEDGFPATARGWTHTSNWVALELLEDCRLTLRLERKAGMPTTVTASNPDGLGLYNLHPAFTIYQGWQESGGDVHNFNNRGDIAWAPDVSYLIHFENNGSHVLEAVVKLEAGRYSVVLGGNSPSALQEGRQGYGATLTTKSYHDPAALAMTRQRLVTRKASFTLRGRVINPEALDEARVQTGGKTTKAKVAGRSWTARVKGLKVGRNAVKLSAHSRDGSVSTVATLIDRLPGPPKATKAPTAPPSPRGRAGKVPHPQSLRLGRSGGR